MTDTPAAPLRCIRQLLKHEWLRPATDQVLLESFVRAGDGAAFETLVKRHGPMVLRVCRRHLD